MNLVVAIRGSTNEQYCLKRKSFLKCGSRFDEDILYKTQNLGGSG